MAGKVKHKKKHRDERRHAREGSVEVVEVAAAAAAAAAVAAGAGADVHECGRSGGVAVAAGGCGRGAAGGAAALRPRGTATPTWPQPQQQLQQLRGGVAAPCPDFPAARAAAPLPPACPSPFPASRDARRMPSGTFVLSITLAHKEDGGAPTPQAHVAWYGSSTSSLMPCDQLSPFLETFKARYNKKKRGPYKEAIRQATSEARRDRHLPVDGTVSMAASPREVNVAS
ncbi:Uncharacterized protein GBIM_09717 [Gryllus bimaculatus]|nr:Uncharacterized protein GBIM_09717 [Gryllus bimaculatus]